MLFVGIVALGGGYLFVRYAAGILLPFVLAWGLGLIIHPVAERLSARTRLPKKLCAVVLLLLLLSLIVGLLVVAADTLLDEIRHLLSRLEADGGGLGRHLADLIERVRRFTSRLPVPERWRHMEGLGQLLDRADDMVNDMVRSTLSQLSSRIPQWIGTLLRAIPSVLLFSLVTLIAGFYFSADLPAIMGALVSLLPAGLGKRLPAIKRRAAQILRQYLRAYLLIWVITFLELYVALSVLGVDYGFLIAALAATVDMLPIFGVGIVLVPWAVAMLVTGQYGLGIGLLITYGIMTVVRQVAEPKLVSSSLGLHPLLTLFCMYAGYRLLGFGGMLLAPVVAIGVAGLLPRSQSSSSGL